MMVQGSTVEFGARCGTPGASSPFEAACDGDVVVTILAPDTGASVQGIVLLSADAQPVIGAIASVRFYIDNVLIGEVAAPGQDGHFTLAWDARGWINKAYTLRVEATDEGEVSGVALRAFFLANDLFTSRQCWWSKVLPTSGIAAPWPVEDADGQARAYDRVTATLINPDRALDDADNWVWTLHANAPGTSTEIGDYQTLDDKRHGIFLGDAQSVRVVVCRERLLVRSTFAIDAREAIRLHAYERDGARVGILTRGPNKVLSFDGSVVSLVADLSEFEQFQPIDFAYAEGRFYVVMEPMPGAPASALPHLRVIDMDDTDRPYRILPDENNSPLTAVAVHEGKLYVAATTAPGESTIYAFAEGDLQRPVAEAVISTALRFEARGATFLACCEGGGLFTIGEGEGGAALVFDTAQARVLAGFGDGATTYAATGDAGRLFSDRGTAWHEEQQFNMAHLRALAALYGSVYVGGSDATLWQRRQGAYVAVDVLEGVSAINDLLEYKDTLLMAASGVGEANALLHRRQVAYKKGIIARTMPHIGFAFEMRDKPEE